MSDEMVGQNEDRKLAKKKPLGRGLGSLLVTHSSATFEDEEEILEPPRPVKNPDTLANPNLPSAASIALQDKNRIWNLGIEQLRGNSEQPRSVFDALPLRELADSIVQKGILQPIVARRVGEGQYEIISGERRWRAAQLAGLKDVPVIVRESDNQDTLELALIENIQRENLNPIEEAEAYLRLIEKYNLTQQQVADKVGKERVTVANSLRLLNLPFEVRQSVSLGEISMGHAKVLLALQDASKIKKMSEVIKKEKLSVRALEKLVSKALKRPQVDANEAPEDDTLQKVAASLAEELQKVIGTKVSIDYSNGQGKTSLFYYSDDELNELVDCIRESWRS